MAANNNNSGFGLALVLITVGGIMVYSGLKGKGVTDILAGEIGGALNPSGGKAKGETTPDSGATAPSPFDQTSSLGTMPSGNSGSPVTSGTGVGPQHETAGLPGYPAKDYFAPSGSPVVSPVTGTVTRLSGHDPASGPTNGPHGPLGWSVYIKSISGSTYFLTHMGSRTVGAGDTVQAGQTIGTVADYAKYGTPSHIHMGIHR